MTTRVEKTITVDVPVSTAYNQWTQFEEFPQFMGGVTQVEQLEDDRLHWVAEIAGVRREWYAAIVEQTPDQKIAWAATEGATNAGAVSFVSSGPGQTAVTLELEYEPEGLVEKAGDALHIVERQAQSDLEKFKTYIESRQQETGGWRGDVGAEGTPTPGVESAAMSQGDSGKAGVSGKVVAAGVAAAAAGVAAAAAARSGSDTDTDTVTETRTDFRDASELPAVDTTEETTYTSAPASEGYVAPNDTYGTEVGAGEEMMSGGVELDSTTSGISDNNDGHPQGGAL
jgi:ribosome-associated toxin RatA of RatAB toxin-antitoxin module